MLTVEGFFNLAVPALTATLAVSMGSFALATLVGTVAGIALVWGGRTTRACVRVYVELFRGTSIYFQLFYIYFVLPALGIYLPPMLAGILALGLNGAAYFAETVRGCILAVPREQTEATIALNLTLRQRVLHVILPQAIVLAIPQLGNMAIEILKGSSLVSLVSLQEITFFALTMRAHLGSSAVPLLSLLVVYYVLAKCLLFVFRKIEARLSRGLDKIGG